VGVIPYNKEVRKAINNIPIAIAITIFLEG
jgi:hypothetical protein